MSTRIVRRLGGVALAAALAGCGLPSAVQDEAPYPSPADLYVAGAIAVVVRYPPGGETSASYAAKLIPALPLGIGPYVSFYPADAPGPTAIVLSFGGDGPWVAACTGPFEPAAAAPPRPAGPVPIQLVGTLCHGNAPAARARGQATAPLDPADPVFQDLVHQVVLTIFRRRNDEHGPLRVSTKS